MKNKTIKAASVLLTLTLITSCFVGGTFAKYVTSDKGSDSARVAKFGVTVTATSNSAFKPTYTTDDSSANSAGITNSVVSSNGEDKVIAPGTKGAITKTTITGTPEVAVRVTNSAAIDLGENWTDEDKKYYCPIKITVNSQEFLGKKYETVDEFETAVKAAIDKVKADYVPGTILDRNASDSDVAISWEWAFTGNDDTKDTFLGNKEEGFVPTISIDVTTTVTQIN